VEQGKKTDQRPSPRDRKSILSNLPEATGKKKSDEESEGALSEEVLSLIIRFGQLICFQREILDRVLRTNMLFQLESKILLHRYSH
jgi:hypothetical protein